MAEYYRLRKTLLALTAYIIVGFMNTSYCVDIDTA